MGTRSNHNLLCSILGARNYENLLRHKQLEAPSGYVREVVTDSSPRLKDLNLPINPFNLMTPISREQLTKPRHQPTLCFSWHADTMGTDWYFRYINKINDCQCSKCSVDIFRRRNFCSDEPRRNSPASSLSSTPQPPKNGRKNWTQKHFFQKKECRSTCVSCS